MTGSSGDSGFTAPFTHRPARLRMFWITASLGACFLGVRWGLRDAPLLWFAALRALLGGAALAVVAITQRRSLPRSAASWGRIGLLGLVNVSLAFWAMFAGIAGLATGTAAVLANAQPLLILLPAWWLFGERVTARTGLALVVGFGGLLVVAVPGGGGQGAVLSLLSAAAVTTGTLMVRQLDGDVVVASAAHLLFGGDGPGERGIRHRGRSAYRLDSTVRGSSAFSRVDRDCSDHLGLVRRDPAMPSVLAHTLDVSCTRLRRAHRYSGPARTT